MNVRNRSLAVLAALAATTSGALAGGGVTIPDLGVDGAGFVSALVTEIGPTVAAAAGLGFAVFGAIFAVRKIKQMVA